MTLESQEPYCSTKCVVCDAIRLAYCHSSNYNPIGFVNESHYDDRVFNHDDWRGTDTMQSPASPLGSVTKPIAVPDESYGYYMDYGTDTGCSRLQNDFLERSFDLSLSVPPCTQGLQSLDLGHLDYTFDTWSMMAPELYIPFPSSENGIDLYEASIYSYGLYTDGRSQAIAFSFIPLPSGMLAEEDHGSLQGFGQSSTSDPCLVDETLDITDSFDLQAYYYDMEASPLQTSQAEGRHSRSTDDTITSEKALENIPLTLRRSQRV
ncbi:hypothetical protein PDIDSM_2428 [Penicillium digitatum]|nr:hypothetical protein PDIDSM_2428 [Penicillium digitatum]